MKKTTTYLTLLLGAALLVLGSPRPARAINLAEAQTARELETSVARHVGISTFTAGEQFLALNVRYIGSSTEAVVSVDNSNVTFYAPYNVADTSIGSSGVLALSTYDTMGALCDAIDATTNYICKLLDSRRSDPTTRLGNQTQSFGLKNLKSAAGYNISFDTGNVAGELINADQLSLGITPAPGKRVILKSCDFNAVSNGVTNPLLTVSGVLKDLENAGDNVTRNDSTVVWSGVISSSITALSQSWAPSGLGGIAFAANPFSNADAFPLGHVVVRVASAASTSLQTAASYLRCYWIER